MKVRLGTHLTGHLGSRYAHVMNDSAGWRGSCPLAISADMLQTAGDPSTPLVVLSELLDICDARRMEFAAVVRSGSCDLDAARAKLVGDPPSPRERELTRLVCAHTALDRGEWVRALELDPASALRSPALKRLLVDSLPVIKHDFELLALGELAQLCLRDAAHAEACQTMIGLIILGLPMPESYGGLIWDLPNMPADANRYCWAAEGDWHKERRGLALHLAGQGVIRALEASRCPGTAEAITQCESIGKKLIARDGGYRGGMGPFECYPSGDNGDCREKTYPIEIDIALPGARAFTETILVLAECDTVNLYDPVVGWLDGGSCNWVGTRPGFLSGPLHSSAHSAPERIRDLVLGGLAMTTMGVIPDPEGFEPRGAVRIDAQGNVQLVAEGDFDGGWPRVVMLSDCTLDRPFPPDENSRVRELLGPDSWAARLAASPKQHLCRACGDVLLYGLGDDQFGVCGACGEDSLDDEGDDEGEDG